MALKSKSLFLYGLQVTESNCSLDFRAVADETPRQATLEVGYYSLSSLATEIVKALQGADSDHVYTCTVDRTIAGGLENRLTISTSSSHFELLFSSGPRSASTLAPLIGFATVDRTGATTYTGSTTCGTSLIPTWIGYSYLSPDFHQEIFGNVNVSASGAKEAVVHGTQKFWQVNFQHEPEEKVISEWKPFMQWAISQKLLEFTPEISNPSVFYQGTLDKTEASGKGLGYRFVEELSNNMANYYKTGNLTFRVKE